MTDQLSLLWRKDSPATSIEAGKTTDRARTRALVLRVLPTIQPATDEALVIACQAADACTPSGVRSRRHELATEGLVVEVGEGRTASGRKALLWAVAS